MYLLPSVQTLMFIIVVKLITKLTFGEMVLGEVIFVKVTLGEITLGEADPNHQNCRLIKHTHTHRISSDPVDMVSMVI